MFAVKSAEKVDKWSESWQELRLQCQVIGAMSDDSRPMEAYRVLAKLVTQAMRARFYLLEKHFPEG